MEARFFFPSATIYSGLSPPFISAANTVPNDLFRKNTLGFLLDFSRYTYIIENLAKELANLGRWTTLSLPGILFAYTLLVGFDHSQSLSKRILGATLLLQLAGYFFIYVLSPHDLVWHMRTSQERLLLHLFPSGLMLLFFSLKTPNFNFLKEWKDASRH